MAIRMHEIRLAAVQASGLTVPEKVRDKLPADFSCSPFVHSDGLTYKVMSQAEAFEYSRKIKKSNARRPHRILVWCVPCKDWFYAGKYIQHKNIVHDRIKPRNQNKSWYY